MFRKILLLAVLAASMICCSSCSLMDPFRIQTISEKKVGAFLKDSRDAIAYLFAVDTAEADREGLDTDLKTRIAAATLGARKEYPTAEGGAYLIPAKEMEEELCGLFDDGDNSGFEGNRFVRRADSGDYLLLNGDWGDSGPTYTILDSFYGLIGSEPTELTVRYSFQYITEDGSLRERYNYEVKYTLVYDESSPYSFKITDYRAKNLIPVE